MAVELKVPSLGMDMEEANILRWLVEEGTRVEKGEPVLEIDTDKTSFEIEAPAAGIVRDIRGAEGETLPVGATLAYIAAPDEKIPGVSPEESLAEERPAPAPPATPGADARDAVEPSAVAHGDGEPRVIRASPAARRAAAARGIALESVSGSGPRGRVYLSDVLEADVREPAPSAEPSPPPIASGPTARDVPASDSRREPLSRVRLLGAQRTARSFGEVPHFYLTRDLAADRLVGLQERLRTKMDPAPSLTELLALAVARTLVGHPRLNARYADGGLEIRDRVDLGLAVATEDGLVVPVLRGADALPLRELVPAAKDLVRRAREGRLHPEELSGGTFTISNLGMMEIDSFDAIINAPEAAILAVGRVRTVPEWQAEEWVPKRVISGTLSVDHRVADGADGARFLMDLQEALEDWELLL